MKTLWVGTGLMLGLAMIGLTIATLMSSDAVSSYRWPSVEGQVIFAEAVLHNRPEDGPAYYTADITYRYEVGAANYFSNLVSFSGYRRSKVNAEAVIATFIPGQAVSVFYDPAQPQKAVLRRGVRGREILELLLGILLCLFGLLGLPFRKNRPPALRLRR